MSTYLVDFDFRQEDLVKSFYFFNYKKYNLTLGELKRKYIFVKKKKLVVKVSVGDIQYIKVEGKYLELYTRDDIFLVRSTLQNMLIDLPIEFIKVHQSYVVNIEKVDSFNPEENVININRMAIPISRNLKKVFLLNIICPSFSESSVIKILLIADDLVIKAISLLKTSVPILLVISADRHAPNDQHREY